MIYTYEEILFVLDAIDAHYAKQKTINKKPFPTHVFLRKHKEALAKALVGKELPADERERWEAIFGFMMDCKRNRK